MHFAECQTTGTRQRCGTRHAKTLPSAGRRQILIFAECRRGKATPETFFPRLLSVFGASRLAWGSNYPSSEGTLPQLLATAQESLRCLAPRDRDWIFAKTAQTLYPALAD